MKKKFFVVICILILSLSLVMMPSCKKTPENEEGELETVESQAEVPATEATTAPMVDQITEKENNADIGSDDEVEIGGETSNATPENSEVESETERENDPVEETDPEDTTPETTEPELRDEAELTDPEIPGEEI